MRKWIGCLVTAVGIVMTVGCGTSSIPTAATSSALSVEENGGSRVSLRQAGIQCSDAPVRWVTQNYSPKGSMYVRWVPAPAVETYQVEVRHNRNGETPTFVYSFYTNRTEATIEDREDGGRYYIRVRVKNPCDVYGAWSETLIIYLDGNAGAGNTTPQEPPYEPPYEPPGDEDGDEDCEEDANNGHGNDCDHDDDSNPS